MKEFIKRFIFWLKPKKRCSYPCMFCEFYDICYDELGKVPNCRRK